MCKRPLILASYFKMSRRVYQVIQNEIKSCYVTGCKITKCILNHVCMFFTYKSLWFEI